MKTKTLLRAGALSLNQNETLVCDSAKGQGLRVKTHVKGGIVGFPPEPQVKTHVKGGIGDIAEQGRQS